MMAALNAEAAGRLHHPGCLRPKPSQHVTATASGLGRRTVVSTRAFNSAESSSRKRPSYRQPLKHWLTGPYATRSSSGHSASEVLGTPDTRKLDALEEEAFHLAHEALGNSVEQEEDAVDEELDALLISHHTVYSAFAGPACTAAEHLPAERSRPAVFALRVEPALQSKLAALEEEAFGRAREALRSSAEETDVTPEDDGSVHSAFAGPAFAATAASAAAVDLPTAGSFRPAVFAHQSDQLPGGKAVGIPASAAAASNDAEQQPPVASGPFGRQALTRGFGSSPRHALAQPRSVTVRSAAAASELVLGAPNRSKLEEYEAEAFRRAACSMRTGSFQSTCSMEEEDDDQESESAKPYMEY